MPSEERSARSNFRGVVGERGVALPPDAGDDVAHRGVHVGRELALEREQCGKSRLEAGLGLLEPHRHDG